MKNMYRFMPFFEEEGSGGGGADGASATGEGKAPEAPASNEGKNAEPVSFKKALEQNPAYQKELDRRVNQAVETATRKERERQRVIQDKMQDEVLRVSQMTQEEKDQYFQRKRETEQAAREASLTRRELTLDARATLQDRHLPESFVSLLDYKDKEACENSISVLEEAFNKAVSAAVEAKLQGGKPPKDASTEGTKPDKKDDTQKAIEEARKIIKRRA